MAKALTKKQTGFVKDYIATGNGTQSALKNYDTKDYKTAGVIAVENLAKPSIAFAIKEALPDELLAAKHLALLNSTRIEHLIFPLETPALMDADIVGMLAEVNCTVRKVIHSETARHVYFWASDNKAVKDALDMAYKVKGNYAPEKTISTNLSVNIVAESNILELANKAAELLKEQKL